MGARFIYRQAIPVDDQWHELELSGPIVHVATRQEDAVEIWFIDDPAASRYVAARIRRARTLRGWSAQHLADVISERGYPMHRASIAALETGDRLVTVDDLVAFAAAFDVNPSRLLGEKALCETCNDNPPPGFACLNCGANAEKGAA